MRRAACLVVAAFLLASMTACGDDASDEEPRIERTEAEAILAQQRYSPEAAACVIDNAAMQNVDLMAVYARDQITPHELEVLGSVQEFCLRRFPLVTTTTIPVEATTTPTTAG